LVRSWTRWAWRRAWPRKRGRKSSGGDFPTSWENDHLDEVIDCTHGGGTANGLCCVRDPWAKPATDSISVERNFTEVCVFARPLAELAAPPTMRHHAETSTTTVADLMLADLRLSHHTLVQQFDRFLLRSGIRCGEAAVLLFAAIDLLLRAMFRGFVPMRISAGQAEKLAWRSSKWKHLGSQLDALQRRTGMNPKRMRQIASEPLVEASGSRRHGLDALTRESQQDL
jgi:hypothetical protein